MNDHDLLRQYVEHESDEAFAELVARHINLVQATALRVLREPQAAQDVVQTVFIRLARKAWTVRTGHALSGWLYRATYHTALNSLQHDQRRRLRETEAMNLAETASRPATWEQLKPLLDEALQLLKPADQDAVMLRYFEGMTARETGAALAISEEAAQKRLSRALEKLRAHFARHDVTVSVVSLVAAFTAQPAHAASADYAARVAQNSLAAGKATGGVSLLAKIVFMTSKTKFVTGAAAMIVLAAVITFLVKFSRDTHRPDPAVLAVQPKVMPRQFAGPAARPIAEMPAASPSQSSKTTSPPADIKPIDDPRADLSTAISEAIRLIQAGDELAFQRKFMPPDDLAKLEQQKSKSADQLFREIDPPDAAAWLRAFEQTKSMSPVMSVNGREAVYALNESIEGYFHTLTFVNVDGLWYWRTSTTEPPAWYQATYLAKPAAPADP